MTSGSLRDAQQKSVGLRSMIVRIESVTDDWVQVVDDFGRNRQLNARFQRVGVKPKVGDRWVIDSDYGDWTLAAILSPITDDGGGTVGPSGSPGPAGPPGPPGAGGVVNVHRIWFQDAMNVPHNSPMNFDFYTSVQNGNTHDAIGTAFNYVPGSPTIRTNVAGLLSWTLTRYWNVSGTMQWWARTEINSVHSSLFTEQQAVLNTGTTTSHSGITDEHMGGSYYVRANEIISVQTTQWSGATQNVGVDYGFTLLELVEGGTAGSAPMVVLTQAQYNALTPKDPNTVYVVTT